MFAEAPLEFRYTSNPVTPDKGFKASLGLKFGMLMKAYTKGKNYVNATGTTLYGKNYIAKEQEKHYFNTTLHCRNREGWLWFYFFRWILPTNPVS